MPKPTPTHSIRHNGTHIVYAISVNDAFGKLQKYQPHSCDLAIRENGWEVVDLDTQARLTADELITSGRASAGIWRWEVV